VQEQNQAAGHIGNMKIQFYMHQNIITSHYCNHKGKNGVTAVSPVSGFPESHFSETKNKFIPQNYLHDKSFNKYTLDGNNRRMNTVRDSRTMELVVRVCDGHGL